MYTKNVYVLVDLIGIIDMFFLCLALRRVRYRYAYILRKAFWFGMIAVSANMLIALSTGPRFAAAAYSLYFISIDWILVYLTGFCLHYTDHTTAVRRMKLPALILMSLDSISILCNFIWHHHFTIYETEFKGAIFYQTEFNFAYFAHLAIDYIAVVVTFALILYRVIKSYDIYRLKYIIIFSVLVLVVAMNLIYMVFAFILDASVIFYAVAGTIIYFCITQLVPKKLITDSIGRAVDDMNEGLILFDVSNQYIISNAFFRERFYPEKEEYTIDSEPVSSMIASLCDENQHYGKATYFRNNKKTGSNEYYQIRYSILNDAKQRPIGSYILVEDVTEEVMYMRQLDDARKDADAASRAKSTFLANMSHEIRTPLNAVLGMNEMILREASKPELIGYAENIRSSGNALLALINDILDFSKIEAGKMDIIESNYDPHQLLRDCCARFEKMAADKKLFFEIKCDENVPSMLGGDIQHISQIVSNLISNAIKYTKTGGVTVSFETSKANNDQRVNISITVSDTGIGISKDDVPLLFNAFERVNEKENATIQGTGLGLAITRDLITLMHGTIDVESEPGKGSSFIVRFDQRIVNPAPRGVFEKNPVENRVIYKEAFRAPDAKILIVDDVSVNILVITELLRKTEVQIDKASSGDEAVAKCNEKKYDLILLDHRMPRKDGIETFREICAGGMNTETPVIMLTANAESGAGDEYKSLGFVDYLTKPVDSKELERSLITYLPAEKIIK